MATDVSRPNLPAAVPSQAIEPSSGVAHHEIVFPEQHAPEQPATVNQVFDYLSADQEPALVAKLRHDWGADAAGEIACGQALARDYPELVRIAERYELDGDHPGILALAARIARLSGYSVVSGTGAGRAARPVSGMTVNERHSFDERVSDVRARKQAALRRGDNRLADMLLEQEMNLYRAHGDASPIVGNDGRTA